MSNETQIRATHPYGFRSGEWATITGVGWLNNRPCYRVVFSDGKDDLWPIHDSADPYEFRPTITHVHDSTCCNRIDDHARGVPHSCNGL